MRLRSERTPAKTPIPISTAINKNTNVQLSVTQKKNIMLITSWNTRVYLCVLPMIRKKGDGDGRMEMVEWRFRRTCDGFCSRVSLPSIFI